MKRNIGYFLGCTLTLVAAISATMGVLASGEKPPQVQATSRLLPEFGDREVQSLGITRLEEMAAKAYEQDKDRWLLRPEVFRQLSFAGKRGALHRYGLIDLKLGKQAIDTADRSQLISESGGDFHPVINPGDNLKVSRATVDRTLGSIQSESNIAVRGQNIIVSYNDFGDNLCGYALSNDGGNTFRPSQVPEIPNGLNLGDGVVDFGPNGDLYYALIGFDGAGRSIIGVARSRDNGVTFTPGADASTTASNRQDFQDKEWMDVDNGANSPFRGNIYVSWTDFTNNGSFILTSRSTDGGQTFSAPIRISPNNGRFAVQGSMPAVAPNGDVYVIYFDANFNPAGGITIVKSTDGGQTFSTPRSAFAYNSVNSITGGGGGVRLGAGPTIAISPNGNVNLAVEGVTANDDPADILYSRSTDGGQTFSPLVKVNDDNTKTAQVLPAMAVAANGNVAIRWWDRRNDANSDNLTDVYMAISSNGGQTFNRNFRITDTNWAFGPPADPASAAYHGDYDHIVSDGDSFFLTWSDERAVFPLTGESDPDTYVTRIPVNRPTLPDFNLSARRAFDTVIAGRSLTMELNSRADDGFNGILNLTATANASGFSFQFASSSMAAGQTTQMTINADASVAPGTYVISAVGTGNGLRRTTTFRVAVLNSNRLVLDTPINATDSKGLSSGGGLAVGSDNVLHFAYNDDSVNVTGNDVVYRQSTDQGRTFSTPVRVSLVDGFTINATVALNSANNIFVVWTDITNTVRLNLARSNDNGRTFSAPIAITPTSQIADLASAAIDPMGNIIVTYLDVASRTNPRVLAVRSTDGGQTFGAPIAISPTGERVNATNRPYVAVDANGAAYIVYSAIEQNGTVSIRFTAAMDGQNFTVNRTLSASNISAFAPHVAVDKDNNVFVTFYNRNGVNPNFNRDIVVVKSTDRGASFGSQVGVSNNAGQSLFSFVIPDARGGVSIAWEDTQDNFLQDIFIARSTDGGMSFGTPSNLSGNSGLSQSAFGAADRDGNVFFGWNDDSNANTEIFINPIILVRPQPPTISAINPTMGSVGSSITITGSNFQRASAVIFGGNITVMPSSFTVSTDGTQIQTTVPMGAQTGPITVITPLGSAVTAVFTVTAAGSFAIDVTPATQNVGVGGMTTFTVNLRAVGNFSGMVNLSAAVTPMNAGITTTFANSNVAVGSNTTLSVQVATNVVPGSFTIALTGVSGQITQVQMVSINVMRVVSITNAVFSRADKRLSITGFGFGVSGARVMVNGQDVSARLAAQADNSIILNGNRKRLNVRAGQNQVVVTSGGLTSNTFTFNN